MDKSVFVYVVVDNYSFKSFRIKYDSYLMNFYDRFIFVGYKCKGFGIVEIERLEDFGFDDKRLD